MLMPGNELARQRAEAERFKATFAEHFDRARTASVDKANYMQSNRQTVELVKLADHVRREAVKFVDELRRA